MPLPSKLLVAAPSEEALLHLSSREVPPGGLFYRIVALAERSPRDSFVGPFNDSETLHKEVNKRELANQLPLSTLAQVEHQNCQRLPPGYCRDARGVRTRHPGSLALSLADVVSGTRALARWFTHGSVDDREIVRRSMICNACPENLPITGCQGCAGQPLRALSEAIVVRSLPTDAVLGACSVCKCSLKTKVRFRLDDLQMSDADRARLPANCWIVADASARDSDPRV